MGGISGFSSCRGIGPAFDRKPQRLKPPLSRRFTAQLKPRRFKALGSFNTARLFKVKRVLAFFRTFLTIAVVAFLLLAASVPAAQNTEGAPGYRIAGIVISSKGGAHLAQARVFLTDVKNPKNTQSVLTTDDGSFEFHAPAGKYALRGAKRGYISANYNEHEQFSTAIVTGAGVDTEGLVLQLAPTAILYGRVLDENGDPIRQAGVTLWKEDHSTGISRIQRFQNDASDDQGAYEFAPLDSGTYFLSVSARPWYAVHPPSLQQEGAPTVLVDRSLDVVYPVTYYAGATESEDATPIPIRGGDRHELELRLVPVPALHVFFHSGQGEGNGFPTPNVQKRVFDEMEFQQSSETQMTAPGVFEIATAPGKYSVRVSGPQGTQVSEVDLSQDHQELDASAGEAMGSITATVHLPEGASVPDQLILGLLDRRGRGIGFQQVGTQGEVNLSEVPPGTYELSVVAPNRAYSVVRTSSGGHVTSGSTLKVSPGTALAVEVFVVSGSARVEGFAKHDGKPASGAMVVLVPKHPGAGRDLFRRDQSDLDGSFTLQGVIPGTYTAIAIADGWDLDWSQPSVISSYAVHGQTIVVPAGSDRPVKLAEPVEVQSK
jgi:hypothetical protein